MSKRHELRQRARAVARDTDSARRQMTGDSFQNLAARTGIGTQNMQASSGYRDGI